MDGKAEIKKIAEAIDFLFDVRLIANTIIEMIKGLIILGIALLIAAIIFLALYLSYICIT